ncbi:MAG: hypothetical protein ACYC0F_18955 [Rhodanobacter sp.]
MRGFMLHLLARLLYPLAIWLRKWLPKPNPDDPWYSEARGQLTPTRRQVVVVPSGV